MASPQPRVRTLHMIAVFILILSSLSCYIDGQIIQNPKSYVELTQGGTALGQLTCTFQRNSPNDVIGWVVDETRISNEGALIDDAISSALGPEAEGKFVLSYSEVLNTDPQQWDYGLDIFDLPSVVSGDYKCQLCTDSSCGSIVAESTIAEVRVAYEPTTPPVCLPPSSDKVLLGDSVTLSCSSDPGVPTLELQWFRGSSTTAEPGQREAVVMDGLLYNNFTFTPVVADSGVAFKCRTSASNPRECTASAFTLISVPSVFVTPPSNAIPVGGSGTFTCSATSDTNTVISTYVWNVEDIPTSRYTVTGTSGNVVTINGITIDDHEKRVECEVTDAENMKGTGFYSILVEGEEVPPDLPTIPPTPPVSHGGSTTPISSTPGPTGGLSTAVIVVIVIVVVVILCLVVAVSLFCYKKRKRESKGTSPPVLKNNLSPTMAAPHKFENTFAHPNVDPKKADPDVIPKGVNERPVDAQKWWRESGAPQDTNPTIKSVNMPFQSKGSKTNLDDPYNYNPTFDDKVDPADLDFKPPLDDHDYSDSGIGYRDGDNGYPMEKYGKSYSDVVYNSDVGYDDRNYDDREYGDGHQDPYPQGYGDPYNGDYGRVYDDDYQSPPEKYGSYDAYPDRMPDGSEGYEPPPEGYSDQPYDGYNEYNPPRDYGEPEYRAPREYGDQPVDYDGQPAAYDDHPSEPTAYDDQPPSDYDYQPPNTGYAPPPEGYSNDPDSYHAAPYEDPDQYNDTYYPDRIPDGGAPESNDYNNYSYAAAESQPGDGYGDGYGDGNVHYDNDGADYVSSSHPNDSYQPAYAESYHSAGHSQEPYYLEEEVSATSNPSYV